MFALQAYDYDLPPQLIAQFPIHPRESSRLLHLKRNSGKFEHRVFTDIVDLINPGDVMVVNNTRVVPARLIGRKVTGGKIELLVLDYAQAVKRAAAATVCACLIKSAKRPKIGTQLLFDAAVTAEVVNAENGFYHVRFVCRDGFDQFIQTCGLTPLPPYIRRDTALGGNPEDRRSYQTVYAAHDGAVAAPTAGLHFSQTLLDKIAAKKVDIIPITLHVGYGTFLPVRVDDIRDHQMHPEWFTIAEDTAQKINQAKSDGRRIIAVGTTCVRTLEYAGRADGQIAAQSGLCDLFIYPKYAFRIVDALITNFHLPQSTLLMLIAAFAGRENILNAYQAAITEEYRFYSYGDAMFID